MDIVQCDPVRLSQVERFQALIYQCAPDAYQSGQVRSERGIHVISL